ncbi:hypothetical protein Godav_002154, partial [Gossypium davidsonii]|nr:hypothetical protein [Gossypium davidsonii]
VYVTAKECSEQLSAEEFAILLGKHFTSFYPQGNVFPTFGRNQSIIALLQRLQMHPIWWLVQNEVFTAIVKIVEKPWERISVNGQPHEHGFKLGSEKHTTEAIVQKSGVLQLTSGVEGLSLLKTTQSGFEGFIRDKYTALPETRERMLATEVTASWRYSYESVSSIPQKSLYFNEQYLNVKKALVDTFFGPPERGVYSASVQSTLLQMAKAVLGRFSDISSVKLKMPNIHFLPVNISSKDHGSIVKFNDDVYLPTDEPHGSIEASLSRFWSKM